MTMTRQFKPSQLKPGLLYDITASQAVYAISASMIITGSVFAKVNTKNNIFLIQSASRDVLTITQSGVVMTSLALNTPVIVSNQGGLPEYVQNNITGMIANTDAASFATAIETFIINTEKYKQLAENIKNMDLNQFMFGEIKILNLYS